ncbi:hypothetical protein G3480_25775 [Thiorhodococcus mannitoliphagus]|uniref:DUF932 domain-containing protein n=1 Tax=Thiorhodococcus mannitoliphagus TaxID=329406 RepID=A0A6P1E536_9GAMM|nr:hypothetical protein [Thiorhodococcus mannitoliphagus]NEX23642.1 hypothetical protein [Thiorhodococcus mannitoliphagus]
MRNHNTDEQKVVSQLTALVDFESQVREVAIDQCPEAHLATNGKRLDIVHRGIAFQGAVLRPLIHQIGGRIWPDVDKFEDIADRWQTRFHQDSRRLESDIANVFSRYDLKIRYVEDGKSNLVYGIVSPQFVEVNQLDFRSRFLQEICNNTGLDARTERVSTRFGNIIEYFHFDSPGFQIGMEYGLVYARNTGYDAYKVDWRRYVLVCTNGLKEWTSKDQAKWHHNHALDLTEFLSDIAKEGVGHQQLLEDRIEIARSTALDRDTASELINRMSLADATKQRLFARTKDESRAVGRNEWALSQALTYMGTHDKHISFQTRRQFTEVGTDILERSLKGVLQGNAQTGKDGFYGMVLPKSLRYH